MKITTFSFTARWRKKSSTKNYAESIFKSVMKKRLLLRRIWIGKHFLSESSSAFYSVRRAINALVCPIICRENFQLSLWKLWTMSVINEAINKFVIWISITFFYNLNFISFSLFVKKDVTSFNLFSYYRHAFGTEFKSLFKKLFQSGVSSLNAITNWRVSWITLLFA